MINKLIHNIARPHHPWRTMKFDELAEIYTSMTLRSLGFGIIGIFVPVFLYKNGVDLQDIFYFYALFFLLRVPVSYATAFIVGRIGPKHTIAISTVIFVVFLSLLLTFEIYDWPLGLMALFFTIANGMFFVAYNTDFSKVNHKKHGGKELGWLYIFERAGYALGPFVGGLIASFIAPELTIVVAVLVMIGSLIPLFMTNEPVKLHQKIDFKGFKPLRYRSNFISLAAFNIENVASTIMWPLLVAVFIFVDDTYAKLGAVIGLGMVISIFSARMFGKFIDNKKGLFLLQYGVIMDSVLHTIRPFITTGAGAIAVSVSNEPITLSYKMPLVKGWYDQADSIEGYRIVYLTWSEMITGFSKGAYCLALFIACYFWDPLTVLRNNFFIVALIALLMFLQKFPALKKV